VSNYLDYIEINELIRSEKEKHKFETVEKTNEIVHETVLKGFVFKDHLIKTTYTDFHNKLANKMCKWHFFLCPKCDKRARKIYADHYNQIGCRTCLKIKERFRTVSKSDRILKIQHYLSELFGNPNLSPKKRKKYINYVVTHFGNLDIKYKTAYNTFVFSGLQNWCLDALHDKNHSDDYRKAVKDVLRKLKDAKKILVQSKLKL
jgi:hypothetical protein